MGKKDKSYLNDIGRFTSFTFIGEVGRYFFLMISSALVTNFFGKEIFGQYSYIISLISILITFSGLGMGSGIIYFGQKYRMTDRLDKAKSVIGFAYINVAVFSLIITVLVIIFSNQISEVLLNGPEYAGILRAMAPLIFIEALFQVSMVVFKSLKRIARFVLVRNIYYHIIRISAILIVFLVFNVSDVNGILIPTYTAYISLTFYSIYKIYRHSELRTPAALNKEEKFEILKYSLPLFMSSILGVVLRQTDILMLGYIKSDEAVAVYKVAVQICSIIPFIKHLTGNFFGPMVSSMYHAGRKKDMVHIYKTITKWEFTFGIMVFIGIVLFGKSVLHIFGKGFISGHTALILVALGAMAKVITGQSGSMIAMTGHPKFNLVNSIVTFTVNIGLNILLIPRHGIIGAAIATMISTILGNSMSLLYLYITQKIQPYNINYLKPIAAAAISYISVRILDKLIMWDGVTDVLIKGSAFVIIFAGTILALKINEDDKTILNGMFSSITKLLKGNK